MTARERSRAQSAAGLALSFGLGLSTLACGDNDELPVRPPRPIAGCETLDVTPCDTADIACQNSRLQIAACLRKTGAGVMPPVTTMTEQGYVDYTNAIWENSATSATNHFEVAMTWIGLARPGSFGFTPLTTDDVSDWLGTYRWRDNDLLLIDHGRRSDDLESNVALVGALVRFMRDRTLDLGAWSTFVSIVDVDSRWGGDALYFGEARFYANRYRAAVEGIDPERYDELTPINREIREDVEWIRTQPSTFLATNDRFPHNFGARAFYLAWQRGGSDAVEALFGSKILTQQLMVSEAEEHEAPAQRFHGKPLAPSSWFEEPNVTAIGAWGLYLSLSQYIAPEAAWKIAIEWHGDQIYVFKAVEPNDETALVWQIEMADDDSAAALETALSKGVSGAEVRRDGTFVTLAKTTDASDLGWAFVEE